VACIDVFHGDADGICALHQLRLADPVPGQLVSGPKRDIALLARVQAGAGDQVTVLDLSLDRNRDHLERLLQAGAGVRWFDHHFAGVVPRHERLRARIEPAPDRSTSFLVDEHLGGRFRAWAVVGTFGDNLDATARQMAAPLGWDAVRVGRLRELGILMNYNGYGATVADLHVPPEELYRRLCPFADPLEFADQEAVCGQLAAGYRDDMARAAALAPELETDTHGLYVLPAAPWARRVGGVLANRLAQGARHRAHALLSRLPEGGYVVSVRAPVDRPGGADQLCRAFATGGGRAAAAGIDRLPEDLYDAFARAFAAAFRGPAACPAGVTPDS
jgi:hypothetical protein